jgi:hypothetical protein
VGKRVKIAREPKAGRGRIGLLLGEVKQAELDENRARQGGLRQGIRTQTRAGDEGPRLRIPTELAFRHAANQIGGDDESRFRSGAGSGDLGGASGGARVTDVEHADREHEQRLGGRRGIAGVLRQGSCLMCATHRVRRQSNAEIERGVLVQQTDREVVLSAAP